MGGPSPGFPTYRSAKPASGVEGEGWKPKLSNPQAHMPTAGSRQAHPGWRAMLSHQAAARGLHRWQWPNGRHADRLTMAQPKGIRALAWMGALN
jgi:hypothetical protein